MKFHLSIDIVSAGAGCLKAREQFEVVRELFEKLAKIIPPGQYYRYNDHWSNITQRLVFLIALTIFLEVGLLVERDTVAQILGSKLNLINFTETFFLNDFFFSYLKQ